MGNLPIGQGLAVTSMQMAVGYTAIANGGMLRPTSSSGTCWATGPGTAEKP
jgi:cell division protein FtsI/penicillin-binding protein 2